MESKSQSKPTGVPGKKKVIRRLVKNAKTGEIIKTEIVRIDSSGEMTVTSYPAGTPVPSLSSLQSQSSGQSKKTIKKAAPEIKKETFSPAKIHSREDERRSEQHQERQHGSRSPPVQLKSPKNEAKKLPLPRAYEEYNANIQDRADMGPSVPANVPGLEDLIKREEELRRESESGLDKHEKAKQGLKDGEESLETALISIVKRKRQRDPKARRRGLVASTMARRMSDEEIDKALDDAYVGDTDYRNIESVKKEMEQEDEEAERRRKERHRRRKEKKHKDRSQADGADHDDVEEYQGETGPLDMPAVESSRKRQEEETPMDTAEASQEGAAEAELSQQLEATSLQKEENDAQPIEDKDMVASDDDDDKKKKKKKKQKHKKKKKKQKKQKKREDGRSGSESEGKEETKKRSRSKSRSISRSRSLSSISLSSISSTFSENFDFAGMDFDPSEESPFDMALNEYQMMRGQFMGPFPGPGFDPYFYRGRGNFRGFPRGPMRGRGFPFPGRGRGGFFPFFPEGGTDDKTGGDAGRGRVQPVSRGPWRGRGLRGRGIPPGFHFNYTEDDTGGCVYVKDTTSSSESESDKKKKKKKHKRRSYSSRSYSTSSSRSSRSRSRHRHRRRHRSSSYSSYSRSSRSYSRSSYSSRSRSYSRSYTRSSRSYSSYSSRSRSRSRSRSSRSRSRSMSPRKDGRNWGSDDGGRRASPSYQAYGGEDVKPPLVGDEEEEEVPWWAEFDKTYEIEKKKIEEEKKKLETVEKMEPEQEKSEEEQPSQSVVSNEEIDVVRCVMNIVDKVKGQQEEVMETARECINDIINQICTRPIMATQLHEESKDPFDKVIHDCVDSILDRVCPNDPQTAARLCLKEIIDTVVEQEEEDKANEEATEMEKEITESKQSRLFQCYLRAQTLTEQIKAQRKAKDIADDVTEAEKQQEGEKPKSDGHRRSDRRRRRGHRRRSRSRSRSRDRGRRRRRGRSSSDSRSRSSSRSSERRIPLVSKESLQQAQAVLLMQQQQLQVAGLLGTGMPNLAGLTQAAALAAGIQPPNLSLPQESAAPADNQESQTKFSKWDKDKDAMLKTKSKDDLTRKLMQRMREKKLQQEEGDLSPTFLARNKDKGQDASADKVFTGPQSLKSRKIAISANFGKLWSKVEGSPKQDDDSQEGAKVEQKSGYNKSDIVAATADAREQLANAEKLKAEENEKKLEIWADQQARLKEEAKREMREQIERAERAKKEKMKEEILEQERQKEIMRIREEVRNQIRKEIQEEIEKQRKSVLEDPTVREKLLQLEALRSESGMIKSEVLQPATSSVGSMPVSSGSSLATGHTPMTTGHASMSEMPERSRWYQQMMNYKQDMKRWMESHRYYESEMDEGQMRMMQMRYMQHWPLQQKQDYMRWYWQSNQFQAPAGFYQQQQNIMQQQMPGTQTATNQMQQRSQDTDTRMLDPKYRGHESKFVPTQAPQHPEPQRQDSSQPPNASYPHGAMGQRAPTQGIPPLMSVSVDKRDRGYEQPQTQPPGYRDAQSRQMFDYQHQRQVRPTVQDRFHWQRDHNKPNQQQGMQPTQQQGMQPNQQQGMQPNQQQGLRPNQQQGLQPNQQQGLQPNQQQAMKPSQQYPQRQPYTAGQEQALQSEQPYSAQQKGLEDNQGSSGFRVGEGPPLHQYPPPGMEEEGRIQSGPPGAAPPGLAPPGTAPPGMVPPVSGPPGIVPIGSGDQPPPPGESVESAKVPELRPPGMEVLAPPGEETNVIAPPTAQPVTTDDAAARSKKKKKQKKHKKHKKRRTRSSSEEEGENDPEAEKAAILKQLQSLQNEGPPEDGATEDVEDGEIASGDEGVPMGTEETAPPIDDVKDIKKRKKHKKEKKKRRRRREGSSDEEQESKHQPPPHMPPPPGPPSGFFQGPPGAPMPGGHPQFDPNRPNYPGMPMKEMPRSLGASGSEYHPRPGAPIYSTPQQREMERGQFPPRGISPGRDPHFMQDRQGYMPHMRDRGAGEPQHLRGHPDSVPHSMGPSGDHKTPMRKRTPSPLPLVIPSDPQEFELWQQKMQARYNDEPLGGGQKGAPEKRPLGGPKGAVDEQLLKDVEMIRRRHGDSEPRPGQSNEDLMMMMRMMDEESRRHRVEGAAGPPPHEDHRKRHGQMPRGARKRSRRQMMRKNYHDWDKPPDDGMIYCMSDSGSSGWGSDSNMDFDQMLAKKRREAGKEGRESMPQRSPQRPPHLDIDMRRNRSPGHMMQWERRDLPPRSENPLQSGEKPQGIPVIGGGPRPIPTNVSSNRPTPPHRHPDMMPPTSQGVPGVDYLPPDIIKMPPQFPPAGFPGDPHAMPPRREGIPPPMPPGGHPIPRLSSQPPPGLPPMMMPPMPPNQGGRMHPMDYDKAMRQRYGM